MSRLVSLSPSQQVATLAFMRRIGLLKKCHSLQPSAIIALEAEQFISSQVLEYELLTNPESDVEEKAVVLSELHVKVKNKQCAWYAVFQTGRVANEERFMSVFNHYDYAHRAYRECAYGQPSLPGRRRRTKAYQCQKEEEQGHTLMECIQQTEAGFLFVTEDAAPMKGIEQFN